MKEQTDYEINKQKNKQKLVRNDFLYNKSKGKYDFPIIRKQEIDVNKIKFLSYANAKNNDEKNVDKTIHFFTYDWLFEKVYENPDDEIEKLSQYYAVLSPDFSIFTNMPLALQIENIFKNRWCGAYWQSKGMKIIPTVSWGDEKSFEFCFDGIEQGSVVAVCTYNRENCEEEFMLGYNKMLEKIKPSIVLCYDEPFKSMKGNIKSFLPTTYEWTKELNWQDLIKFKWEKQNRNVSGLNKKSFKYFDYDDPYVKDEIIKCNICGKVAIQDQYGNGVCENCGWKFSKDENNFEKELGISYPMLVPPSRAREQYQKGLPFNATFEDFIKGLYYYSEMIFTYKGIDYEVFFKKNYTVIFCSTNMQQEFKTKEEFFNKATIDSKLLKDIWHEVENAGFMFCE